MPLLGDAIHHFTIVLTCVFITVTSASFVSRSTVAHTNKTIKLSDRKKWCRHGVVNDVVTAMVKVSVYFTRMH